MLTPTIGPNWHNEELQRTPDMLKAIVKQLDDPNVVLTEEERAGLLARGSALNAIRKQTADKMQAYRDRYNEAYSDESPLSDAEKFAKLEEAKAIAIELPRREFFDVAISAQIKLILSTRDETIEAARRSESAKMLLVEIEPPLLNIKTRFDSNLNKNSFYCAEVGLKDFSDRTQKIEALQAVAGVALQDAEKAEAPKTMLGTMFDALIDRAQTFLVMADKLPGGLGQNVYEVACLGVCLEHSRQIADSEAHEEKLTILLNQSVAAAGALLRASPDAVDLESAIKCAWHFFHINGYGKPSGVTQEARDGLAQDIGSACDWQIENGYHFGRKWERYQELLGLREDLVEKAYKEYLAEQNAKPGNALKDVPALQ